MMRRLSRNCSMILRPRYATRNGGYTRMFRLGPRLGDAAEMVLLELVEE